jgi:deoxyadenosine/deoxycytidine kinase
MANTVFRFLEEPVDVWSSIQDKNGKNILEKYYADQTKYAFSFQMMAYISRLSLLRKAIKNTSSKFKKNPVIFSIEGNIGTGKSTLIQNLQKHFAGAGASEAGASEAGASEAGASEADTIVTERSLYTDCHVFAQMLYDTNKIEDVEFEIYRKWFDEFIEDLPAFAFIYIRCEPQVSFARVNKRARNCESVIPLSYLENCHLYHERWLMSSNKKNRILVIDANSDINEDGELLSKWIKQIEEFILF